LIHRALRRRFGGAEPHQPHAMPEAAIGEMVIGDLDAGIGRARQNGSGLRLPSSKKRWGSFARVSRVSASLRIASGTARRWR
jgi:hypothetical protein